MMKILDIALKDMLRYFRSALAVGFMFVIPLLITGLIYFAFGDVLQSGETGNYSMPLIKVQMVNLDQGDTQGQVNLGKILIDALTNDSAKNIFKVTFAQDEPAARQAVDQKQADLALIIPADFTQVAMSDTSQAAVTMYQDPTLSFGPGITKEIIDQFLDAFSGGSITSRVMADQFSARGLTLNTNLKTEAQVSYSQWFQSLGKDNQWNLPVIKRLPNKETPKSIGDHRTTLLGPVMAGMLIFFVFFTGTNTAQTILREQEEGTLARLFTTPTPLASILGGKFLAVFITLIVQSIVLTIASALAFQIDWGNLATLALVITGLVIAASGFGIFLISFIKTDRQAGALSGGVLAVMGMVGGLFTTGFSGANIFEKVGIVVPQGWALRGMKLALSGAAPQDALIPLAVLLAFGLVFFIIGVQKMRTRFA